MPRLHALALIASFALTVAACGRPLGGASALTVDGAAARPCADREAFSDCSPQQIAAELQSSESQLDRTRSQVAGLESQEDGLEARLEGEPEVKVKAEPDADGIGLTQAPTEQERLRLEIERLEREIALLKKEIEALEKKIALLKSLLQNPPAQPAAGGQVACIDFEGVRAQSGRERVTTCSDLPAAQCSEYRTVISETSNPRTVVGRVKRTGATCAQFPAGTWLTNAPSQPSAPTQPTAPTAPTSPTTPSIPVAPQTGCKCVKEQGPWIGNRATLWCVVRSSAGHALLWDNVTPSDPDCRSTCTTLLGAAQCR